MFMNIFIIYSDRCLIIPENKGKLMPSDLSEYIS